MMRWRDILFLAAAVVVLTGRAAEAQTLRLRAQARVEGPAVCVGDIALIEGADAAAAEDLAQRVLVAKLDGAVRVKAEEVLFALAAQDRALAAKLQVCGAAECLVSPAGTGPATAPAAGGMARANQALAAERPVVTAAVLPQAKGGAAAAAGDEGTGQTLAELLTQQVVSELAVGREDIRITFETVSPLLDQPVPARHHWQFKPLARQFIGAVQWEAQLIEGRQVIKKMVVQARVLRRVQVLVATALINRGETLEARQCAAEERWVDRRIPSLFTSAKEALGQEALRNVAVGSALDQRDFKAAEMASRGDPVTVYFVSGGLKVKQAGRAMEAGRLHDRITVRNEVTGEKYDGTLIGRHLVTVGAVEPAAEQQLREER